MTPTHARALAAVSLATLLSACGRSSVTPNVEKPFTGWITVAGMRCADGSPTGIGVSPGRSDAVLVYLAGGGACWGAAACSTSVPRSFGSFEYTIAQLFASGTIFDRTLAGNPFATWTWVLVPYCTGDVHAGDTVSYHGGVRWDHHGWRNLQAAVTAFTSELSPPAHLVVAGSSAGGFGTLAAYDLVRAAWDPSHGTTAALLDDSGPTFVGTATPPALLSTWWDAWGLGSTLGTTCPACATDLSAAWDVLLANHPGDRLALLSTTQDGTMRGFFADASLSIPQETPQEFEANLAALAAKLAGMPNVAAYRIGSPFVTSHASLVQASVLQSAQGAATLEWLSELVALDPAWTSSVAPPP